jgi:hypothetical protein
MKLDLSLSLAQAEPKYKKVAVAAAWLPAKPAKLLKFVFYMQLICNKHINLTINNKKGSCGRHSCLQDLPKL